MGGLEDRVARDVVDVGARRDADAAHLRGQGVGHVIAVEVQRGDHVEVVGPRQHLLESDSAIKSLMTMPCPASRSSCTTVRRRSPRAELALASS